MQGYKRESVERYYMCGLSFAGMCAEMDVKDPTFKAVLGGSVDEDEDEDDEDDEDAETHGKKLGRVRDEVKTFPSFAPYPSKPPSGDEAAKAEWEAKKVRPRQRVAGRTSQ